MIGALAEADRTMEGVVLLGAEISFAAKNRKSPERRSIGQR